MNANNGIFSAPGRIKAFKRRVFASLAALVSPQTALRRYSIAVGVVVMITAARWLLLPVLGTRYPFVTLFPTVLIASVLAGFGPGLLAAVLCFAIAASSWIPGVGHWSLGDPVDRIAMLLNLAGVFMVCFVAEVLRRSQFELKQNQAHLEELIEQRTSELRAEISRRERTESELRAASVAKDHFLAALSHELRTPLNPVLLLATEGAANPQLPPEVRQDLEVIAKNIQLEARLIDDLLDVTRIVHGKTSLRFERVDAHVVLTEAIDKVMPELTARGLQFVQQREAVSSHVMADPARLEQVFCNLLTNAVKFTSAGHVAVRTATRENQLVIEAADTGMGMTAEELARVFTPFVQGDHAVTGKPSPFAGLGLGLSIARGLVQLHAGVVEAFSDGPNKGATFRVRLPLVEAPRRSELGTVEGAAAPVDVEGTAAIDDVLLVEDHDATRAAVEYLLVRRRCAVVGVASAAAALKAAAAQRFAFVISDIGLPDQSGYELMTALRERYGLRGIAISGYGTAEDIARSRAAGFLEHLTKPITVKALEEALRTMRQAAGDPAGTAAPAGAGPVERNPRASYASEQAS